MVGLPCDLWVAAPIVIFVAGAGGAFDPSDPRYHAMHKPAKQPPDWLFGPVSPAIFILTALAGMHRALVLLRY